MPRWQNITIIELIAIDGLAIISFILKKHSHLYVITIFIRDIPRCPDKKHMTLMISNRIDLRHIKNLRPEESFIAVNTRRRPIDLAYLLKTFTIYFKPAEEY